MWLERAKCMRAKQRNSKISYTPLYDRLRSTSNVDFKYKRQSSAASMNINQVRKHALSLEAVTEEPHHHFSSFRVRGKIFVTLPPDNEHIHVFVSEDVREQAIAANPAFMEKLLWGGKVVGVRIHLPHAVGTVVKQLVQTAYETRVAKDAKPKMLR